MTKPMTAEEELAFLRAENERLKQGKVRSVSVKVSEKGCVSLYGLGRFPVSLYPEQWFTLMDNIEGVRDYLVSNANSLKTKDGGSLASSPAMARYAKAKPAQKPVVAKKPHNVDAVTARMSNGSA